MFCDYCKALDSVPQRPLLSKLSQFGIDASIVHWVADSLTVVIELLSMELLLTVLQCSLKCCRG